MTDILAPVRPPAPVVPPVVTGDTGQPAALLETDAERLQHDREAHLATDPRPATDLPSAVVRPGDERKIVTGEPVVPALVDGPIDPNHAKRVVAESRGHHIVEDPDSHARYCENCRTAEWAALDGQDCVPRLDNAAAPALPPDAVDVPVEAPEAA